MGDWGTTGPPMTVPTNFCRPLRLQVKTTHLAPGRIFLRGLLILLSGAYPSPGDEPRPSPGPKAAVLAPGVGQLTWPRALANQVSDYLYIERSGDGGASWSVVARRQVGASEYIDAALTAGKPYLWRVRGGDGSTSPATAEMTIPKDPAVPGSPSGLTAEPASPCRTILKWIPDALRSEDGFQVDRSADDGKTWRRVGNAWRGIVEFADLGLSPGTSYRWRVRSANAGGHSAWAEAGPAATPPAARVASPAAPSRLSALAADESRVSLEWALGDESEEGTRVEVSADGGASWEERLVVGRWSWQAYVTGLAPRTTYQFRVRAFNDGGDSPPSAPAAVTTLDTGKIYSPTGRNPRLFLTPQQWRIYRRMGADFAAAPSAPKTWGGRMYRALKANADRSHTTPAYGDYGQWAAIMFQITGDRDYARAAYERAMAQDRPGISGYAAADLNRVTIPGNNANHVREYFLDLVWIYDWIAAGLTPDQRRAYARGMAGYCKWCLAIDVDTYRGGFRCGPDQNPDSDQATGQYFGLACWDLVAVGDDPKAGFWTAETAFSPFCAVPGGFPVGGLRASADDYSSVVNAVTRRFAAYAAGGEWFESSEYNPGTGVLMGMGIEAIRMARSYEGDNQDYHAELRTVSRQLGLMEVLRFTPDLKQVWQWGDDETPRILGGNGYVSGRQTCLGLHAGLARGQPGVGPNCLGMAAELWRSAPASRNGGDAPNSRFYLRIDPYAARSPKSDLPRRHFARGMGLMYWHDGWDRASSFLGVFMPPRTLADHEVNFFGDFQLYRRGEWALTHPLGYGSLVPEGEAANSMLIGGLSSMAGLNLAPRDVDPASFRGSVAQEFGSQPRFAYLAGATSGNYYGKT